MNRCLPETLAALLIATSILCAAPQVSLLTDPNVGQPASHGLAVLEQALQARGLDVRRHVGAGAVQGDLVVLAGLSQSNSRAASALAAAKVAPPVGPEALTVRRTAFQGKPAVILCGADSRGLMYAALDTADRVSWAEASSSPFAHVRDVSEKPFVRERGISIYTMQRAYFESRLYDEEHWKRYFDLLARSRINMFVVIFGYENGGFLAPPYPYFFDLGEFPQVRLVGITQEQQQRNIAAMKAMMRLAHERGIDVITAIWDHIYRGGVQGGGIPGASEKAAQPTPGLVWGLTEDNLAAYTKTALRKYLDTFPEIDALQFRMHGESGLKKSEMEGFWHEVFGIVRQHRPGMLVDLRAKELPDTIIDDALQQGLRARVSTKYWMEQMGMPFHPTHVNPQNQKDRRHGYADLLRYPQRFKVHWQLWNGGTTRLLLWADPGYVRRFAQSTRLYAGDSFDVNEMLATKMLAEPHEASPLPILNQKYRYYDYEFERYWHFYQLWGRLSYDPEAAPETWEREFSRRIGSSAASHLMNAVHSASQVLPRIVAASYRYNYFPTTRGWAEMMRQDDLPVFAGEQGSDTQQFMNARDGARIVLAGTDTAMRRPEETSQWFSRVSAEILDRAARAETESGEKRNNEFLSTVTDCRILAWLAKYHSQRLLAAIDYNLFKESGDVSPLGDAIAYERQAMAAWKEMSLSAGDVYSDTLAFGVHRLGFNHHWREELPRFEQGLEKLTAERQQALKSLATGSLRIAHVPVRRLSPGGKLEVRASVFSGTSLGSVALHMAEQEGSFRTIPLSVDQPGLFRCSVPLSRKEGSVRYYIEAADSSGSHVYNPANGREDPITVTVTADVEPPHVRFEAVNQAQPGEDLRVSARVEDLSGVKSVRLRYRHLTQFEDYQLVEMQREGDTSRFAAHIPGAFIQPEWDLMYFVEAIDIKGNGRMFPDLETELPYVIVPVRR